MPQYLHTISQQQLADFFSPRSGEDKIGQVIGLYDSNNSLEQYSNQGYRFAIVGIPEQIGPVANCGQGGAHKGWLAFLSYFLNLQSNQFFSARDVLLLGEIECDDLAPTTKLDKNRQLCAELDTRVAAVLEPVFAAGLIPVVVGGGHNNAYPIIKSCSTARNMPMAVANLDPHSDFRQQEGRHSGNPFRYAYDEGFLQRYAVLGLHEQKNSDAALDALKQLEFPFYTVQQTHWRQELSYDQCLEEISRYLLNSGFPVGIELDLDVISEMPTSAITRCGVSANDALYYVEQLAKLPEIQYLHLAEGAPERHPAGEQHGNRVVGQALAELACAFIKSIKAQDID